MTKCSVIVAKLSQKNPRCPKNSSCPKIQPELLLLLLGGFQEEGGENKAKKADLGCQREQQIRPNPPGQRCPGARHKPQRDRRLRSSSHSSQSFPPELLLPVLGGIGAAGEKNGDFGVFREICGVFTLGKGQAWGSGTEFQPSTSTLGIPVARCLSGV